MASEGKIVTLAIPEAEFEGLLRHTSGLLGKQRKEREKQVMAKLFEIVKKEKHSSAA
jgi:hypothetical protein